MIRRISAIAKCTRSFVRSKCHLMETPHLEKGFCRFDLCFDNISRSKFATCPRMPKGYPVKSAPISSQHQEADLLCDSWQPLQSVEIMFHTETSTILTIWKVDSAAQANLLQLCARFDPLGFPKLHLLGIPDLGSHLQWFGSQPRFVGFVLGGGRSLEGPGIFKMFEPLWYTMCTMVKTFLSSISQPDRFENMVLWVLWNRMKVNPSNQEAHF